MRESFGVYEREKNRQTKNDNLSLKLNIAALSRRRGEERTKHENILSILLTLSYRRYYKKNHEELSSVSEN